MEEMTNRARPGGLPEVNFKPFHDRVLVLRALAEEAPAGNIVIPDNEKEPPLEGRVIARGPGRVEMGGWVSPSAEPGDVVLFDKYAGVPVVVDGQEYLLLRDEELLGRRQQKLTEGQKPYEEPQPRPSEKATTVFHRAAPCLNRADQETEHA